MLITASFAQVKSCVYFIAIKSHFIEEDGKIFII